MKGFRFVLLLAAVLLAIPMPAQNKVKPADFGIKSKKALKLYQEGIQQARWRNRQQAMDLFAAAIDLEPQFAHAHFQLGVNAFVKRKYGESVEHLEAAYQSDEANFRQIDFYLGEAYFKTGRYEEAVPLLDAFLIGGEGRKQDLTRAVIDLRHAQFAAKAIKKPVDFNPVNLGEQINTAEDEYLPHLNADGSFLLFTSRRPESTGGYNPALRGFDEDFFFASYADGKWSPAQNLGSPINSRESEGAASITQNGQTIFFTACNLKIGYGNCDLYMAQKVGDNWSEPENLGDLVNCEGWDSQPCLSPDGKRLYFSSTRAGGIGGRDIWYTEKVEGKWTAAKNMGAPINSEGNETSPFIHADGNTFYFSSDFHPGFGSQDLFRSTLDVDGQWSYPENLGYPLNTHADESNIFVSTDGTRGFINSDREGGLGKSDLYEFEMDRRIRPKVATFLRGITMDSLTEAPVKARIRLIDVATGDTIRDEYSDGQNGRFLMSLPLEKHYAAYVTAPEYLFVSKSFFLHDVVEETYFDLMVPLTKIKKGVPVRLDNIFFAFGEYKLEEASRTELDFLYQYLQDQDEIRIEISGHTDDVGSDAKNLRLSQQRANAVKAYLVDLGIEPTRIVAKGYGETEPVAENDSEEGRALNRRTEFTIIE